jgi:soluble lytic murein transglycosylase-like protein
MIEGYILSIVLSLASQYNVPSNLVVAIIFEESTGNSNAIGYNPNGTVDRGLMQLNSSWFTDDRWHEPEINIRAGIQHLFYLYRELQNWDSVIIAYNCGLGRYREGPPEMSLSYYNKIKKHWNYLDTVGMEQ